MEGGEAGAELRCESRTWQPGVSPDCLLLFTLLSPFEELGIMNWGGGGWGGKGGCPSRQPPGLANGSRSLSELAFAVYPGHLHILERGTKGTELLIFNFNISTPCL